MADKIIFNLSEEISVGTEGEFEKYYAIELFPPTFMCFPEASKLEQSVTRALKEMADKANLTKEDIEEAKQKINEAKEKKTDISSEIDKEEKYGADEVRIALLTSHEDISEIIKTFIKLCTYVARFDENVNVKEKHIKKMTYKDILNMTCFYIANFLMP